MRNYIKKKQKDFDFELFQEDADVAKFNLALNRRKISVSLTLLISAVFVALFITQKSFNEISLGEESKIELSSMPIASSIVKKGIISVPSGMVKANPFLPYRNLGEEVAVGDLPNIELLEPPETLNENSDAARIMDTIVSGILYDKFSPSAILNIEGNDYLVKKGDVVNNYKVLSILEDSVTVKLGANVYKAGIGEILTEGTLNHNNVSNLNNKFGGVQ